MTNEEKITRLDVIIEQMQKVHNDLCKENKNRSNSKEVSKIFRGCSRFIRITKNVKR